MVVERVARADRLVPRGTWWRQPSVGPSQRRREI